MEFYDFPETVGNFIIPTDELHDFSEGWGRSTTNQTISAGESSGVDSCRRFEHDGLNHQLVTLWLWLT